MTDWTRSTVPAGLLVALSVSSLGGCGGAPKPAPVDDPPVSASSSPTGAPTLPAEAKGTTPEAAEAFVRYYLATFSSALESNDLSEVGELSAPECRACSALMDRVKKTYAAGGSIKGRGYAIEEFSVDPASTSTRVVLRGSVTQYAQDFKESSSSAVKHTEEAPLPSIFVVRPKDEAWLLVNWERT